MHLLRALVLVDGDAMALEYLASTRAVALVLGLDLLDVRVGSAETVALAVRLGLRRVRVSRHVPGAVGLMNRRGEQRGPLGRGFAGAALIEVGDALHGDERILPGPGSMLARREGDVDLADLVREAECGGALGLARLDLLARS